MTASAADTRAEPGPEDRASPPSGAPDAAVPTDAQVIAAVTGGDAESFVLLVHRYRDAYGRFARCMLADARRADAAVQAALVRAYAGLEGSPRDGFGGWLYALVVQECAAVEARGEPVPHDDAGGPAEDALVREALARVPVREREAFVLRHVEELTDEEMTRLTGDSAAILDARVGEAWRVLREQLAADGVATSEGSADHDDVAARVTSVLRVPHPVRDDLEARVMAAVRVEARVRERVRVRRRPSGAMDAVAAEEERPRRATGMTPLGLTALVVVVGLLAAAMGLWLGRSSAARPSSPVVAPVAPLASAPVLDTLHVVRFTYADSTARSVSLIGDFNAWSPEATPMTRDAAAGWSVAIPLSEGRHEYAFVVDGVTPQETALIVVEPR